MRKSNFFKKAFSSVGRSSPHFQKMKQVALHIVLTFLLVGSLAVIGSGFFVVLASPDAGEEFSIEVTASAPDNMELNNQLTSINYRLETMESDLESEIEEMQESNVKLDTIAGLLGYVFGALFLLIVIVMFIAFYKLFNRFFRF